MCVDIASITMLYGTTSNKIILLDKPKKIATKISWLATIIVASLEDAAFAKRGIISFSFSSPELVTLASL